MVAVGALEPRSSCDRASSKLARSDLNPMVLTLAMLLAVTSSMVWWTVRPLMAENIARMVILFLSPADRFPGWGPASSARSGGFGG